MPESLKNLAELQERIRSLEGSALTEINQAIEEKSVLLKFKHWNGSTVAVHCTAVILCNVSILDQNSGNSEVIGVELNVLERGGLQLLEKLGYLWDTKQTQEEHFDYPLVYLSINGDTCVAVVCGRVDLGARAAPINQHR